MINVGPGWICDIKAKTREKFDGLANQKNNFPYQRELAK